MGVAEGWLGKSSNSKIVLGPADKLSEEVQTWARESARHGFKAQLYYLPLFATSGKLLNFSVPQFPYPK